MLVEFVQLGGCPGCPSNALVSLAPHITRARVLHRVSVLDLYHLEPCRCVRHALILAAAQP